MHVILQFSPCLKIALEDDMEDCEVVANLLRAFSAGDVFDITSLDSPKVISRSI